MLYNTSGKTSKHPVVFEKAPVLFLKALDLFKKSRRFLDIVA